VILALLFFLSAFLACSFLVLVIYFIQETVHIIHQGPKPQKMELLWAGIAITIFLLFAFASLLFTIFSCFHIVKGRVKILPMPTSVYEEQPWLSCNCHDHGLQQPARIKVWLNVYFAKTLYKQLFALYICNLASVVTKI
jgi:hypothetical protein